MLPPLKAASKAADTGDVEHSSAELPHEREPVEVDEPKLELVPEPPAAEEPEAEAEADAGSDDDEPTDAPAEGATTDSEEA